MATAALSRKTTQTRGLGTRSENVFFAGMALLFMATAFTGFARTYFLAGVFRAPLPSVIIHIHAVVFSAWILLLIAQISLVSADRVDIHRRLGIAGFVLACLMVIVGILAGSNMLAREVAPPGLDAKTFFAVPVGHMILFPVLVWSAYRARFNPSAHKRLILIATILLLDAATARSPLNVITNKPYLSGIFVYGFVLLIVAYDLWSTRRVNRATLWAGALVVVVPHLLVPIGSTTGWHTFASWVQNLAQSAR
jgi:hypothetical protein